MPKICEFYGIAIYIYYRDHSPAHFHAIYGDFDALIAIESMDIIEGKLPNRALAMIVEWGRVHQEELQLAWLDACKMQPIRKIAPLQ